MDIQKMKAAEKKIWLKTEFVDIGWKRGQESPFIFTDEQRVMQVLLGIQSNAIKFTEEGGVQIKVKIIESKGHKYLEISVIDTGIGIKYEDQDKLFKLFGFLQDSKELNTKGIGLGLVISDQIVTEFGGKVTFVSEPDVGSTFKFTFRLSDSEEEEESKNGK